MTKQEMIDKIYEKIADKTLSFGCKVICGEVDFGYDKENFIKTFGTFDEKIIKPYSARKTDIELDGLYYLNTSPIGHPVMIGDCDILIKIGPEYFEDRIPILDLRIDKRKPIEEQSKECITFVYDLIK